MGDNEKVTHQKKLLVKDFFKKLIRQRDFCLKYIQDILLLHIA